MSKLVKCIVKWPKGLWHGSKQYQDGDKLELPAHTVDSKRTRGNLYAKGEYEGKQAAAKASLEAAQEEKDARNTAAQEDKAPEEEKKETPKSKTGAGSKGS